MHVETLLEKVNVVVTGVLLGLELVDDVFTEETLDEIFAEDVDDEIFADDLVEEENTLLCGVDDVFTDEPVDEE
jgi:hypothetical protein